MELGDSAAVIPDSFMGYRDDITMQMTMILDQIRAPLIVPVLRLAVYICLTMSVMLFVERVYMGIVISLVKLFGRKPEKRFKWEPMKDDIEHGNSVYPMVLVQIPMYNEREVPSTNQNSVSCSVSYSVPYSVLFIDLLCV